MNKICLEVLTVFDYGFNPIIGLDALSTLLLSNAPDIAAACKFRTDSGVFFSLHNNTPHHPLLKKVTFRVKVIILTKFAYIVILMVCIHLRILSALNSDSFLQTTQ